MQLHHLPPGIFDKNTQLVKLWVKLFFLCDARVKIIQDRKLNNINKICKYFIHNMELFKHIKNSPTVNTTGQLSHLLTENSDLRTAAQQY